MYICNVDVSHLTKEEAKKQLLNSVEQEITAEKAALIRDLEQKAKEEAKQQKVEAKQQKAEAKKKKAEAKAQAKKAQAK